MGRPKGSKNKDQYPPPECHPDRPLHAKKMCLACYQRQRRATYPGAAEGHRKASKRWLKANKHKGLEFSRRSRYGLEPEDYKRLQDLFDGKCGICKQETKLAIDHCHVTMRVRGLLCRSCNLALGLYEKLQQAGDVQGYLNNDLGFSARYNRPNGKFT